MTSTATLDFNMLEQNTVSVLDSKKENIILYNTAKGFTRFVKMRFDDKFEIRYYKDSYGEKVKEKDSFLSFIHIETTRDLAVFDFLYTISKKVFVICNIEQINNRITRLNGVTLIDPFMLRKDLYRSIEGAINKIEQVRNN